MNTVKLYDSAVQFYFDCDYLARGIGVMYCDERTLCASVCLSVCLLTYLQNHMAKLHQIFVHVASGHSRSMVIV